MNSIAIIEAVNTTSLPFHGQQVITAMVAGVAYVAMKPIVENIGLSWSSQVQKMLKMKDKFNYVDIDMVASDGKKRIMGCIPLKKLNGWLFSINPAKVRDDIRDRLIRYQEECFTALHDYWNKGISVRQPESTVDDHTPLRGIVNRIMGKYGLTYQAVYKLVHKEFGVKHIEELSPKQTAEAVEYLAAKAIEGEWLPKQESLPEIKKQFTDDELCTMAWLWMHSNMMADHMLSIEPILQAAEHRLAGAYCSMPRETIRERNAVRRMLERETAHIQVSPWEDGKMRVLKKLRIDNKRFLEMAGV